MTANAVAVLPVVHAPYGAACVASMASSFRERTLVVDNTVDNRGVMRSHNLGIDHMRERGADWLVVVSAAIRFGERGGLDFLDALDANPDLAVVEASGVFGWHLIAFSRECIERAGRWDAQLSPYGFDDLDMSWRIQLAYDRRAPWEKVDVDVRDMGMGHSIKLAGVEAPAARPLLYYCLKWNVTIAEDGAKSDPTFTRPWGNPANPIGYWPTTAEGDRWDA